MEDEDFELHEDFVPSAEPSPVCAAWHVRSVGEDSVALLYPDPGEDFELLEDSARDGDWPGYEDSAQAYEDSGVHETSGTARLVIGLLCLCYSMSDVDSEGVVCSHEVCSRN